ncbi:TonB-dependent receptor plug domain-containing protein [Stakelama sp. CBK3Z-3]|uniref:TonB-dependent receptor plug domain-containing protein n=1 Tax=Stakelama flava TaxID=2860338 RepID=A0ABS6XIA5_9SPHN|nr:TonB-dependent receptor plug domain-containing protein [Stakelama flava]MBW4329928.1 TonB-dependent receptor plug domain-containing protein [Stakelama flava]
MKTGFWLSMSVVAFFCATRAQAQEAAVDPDPAQAVSDNPSVPEDDVSKDIVVTAERRSTSLQRTSVAATVLTGDDLVKKSVNTVDQLQFASPSLTVNNAGQGNQFNIRGIGKGEVGSTVGVGVITYRDGVATFPGYFQSEPYYDIASVEVLRGPQGTFAGQNATGGAVFITEANPVLNEISGYALAQYGNYNDIKLQGAANLPVSDTLAVRIANNTQVRDSFYDASGSYYGDLGKLRSQSMRISMLWQPTSQLRVLLKGDYNNISTGGYPGSPATATSDPFTITNNAYNHSKDESGRIVLDATYTFAGGVQLRSISGYQRGTTQEDIDYDGSSAANYTFHDYVNERILSQEVNLVSPDTGPFTWVLGGYWQDDKYTFPEGGYLLTEPGIITLALQGENPHTTLAGFGQVGFELAQGLQIEAGARWTRSTSRNTATYTVVNYGISIPQDDFTADKKVTGKVALNWTIDADNFVYAFVATGHKAGGLNGVNLSFVTPQPFEPEEVTDYEIGWKATLLNGHLRTQLGGYYNDYRNFQVSIVDPDTPAITSVYNVPSSTKLYGVEFSAQGSFGGLAFDLAASVSNSKLGRFYAFDPRLAHSGVCDPETGPETATCLDLTGNRQSYAPRFTLSTGIQYAIALNDNMTLTPRVDYSHISSTWGTLFEQRALGDFLVARDIVNAQLTLDKGPWTIAAYSTNLTDQHYIAAINNLRRLAGAPRQYGVRVSRSF